MKLRQQRVLTFPMQQVVSGDGLEVEFGGCLEEQFGGGGDARRLVADGPDAQAVEAGLQLGTQDKDGVGFPYV